MDNCSTLLNFATSNHALVLEATLVLLIARMILSKLLRHGVKTIFPRWGGHLAQYGPDLYIQGGCTWLATLQQQRSKAHPSGRKSRDRCTVIFFDLQSAGAFGRNHRASDAGMSLDPPGVRIGCHGHRTSATVLVLWPILVILAHFGPDLSKNNDCGRAATWWQPSFNHWLKVF